MKFTTKRIRTDDAGLGYEAYWPCALCDAIFTPGTEIVELYAEDGMPDTFYFISGEYYLCEKCCDTNTDQIREMFTRLAADLESKRPIIQQWHKWTEYVIKTFSDILPEEIPLLFGWLKSQASEREKELQDLEQNYEYRVVASKKAFTENLSGATKYPISDNAGYVYLLGSPDGYCKIGRAKHLSARLLSIGLQLPFRVEILHSIKVSDRVWAERALHEKFAQCRANGEWFLLNAEDINWIKSLTRLEPGETD